MRRGSRSRPTTSRDALLTEFGKDTLRDRYLLPGESYQDLFARVAAAYADDADHAQRIYDYISKLWFMPATPVLSQRRHRPRPADLLLPEQRRRQPRRHRRHLERECLAGVQGRRHRHLLGQRARHRREGRPERQDQRHHPVRPGDGSPDAGDQPGLAAPRLGRRLPRHLASRDRGVPRDPQADRATSTARRSTCTTACSSPTSSWTRCATATSSRCAARRTARCAARSTRARCSRSWSRRASRPASRTSSSSTTVNKAMPKHHRDLGLKVTTSNLCSRDHAADRQRPPRRRPHRGLLPLLAQPRDLGRVERATSSSSRTSCASSTTCCRTSSPARPTRWRAPSTAPSASARSASA